MTSWAFKPAAELAAAVRAGDLDTIAAARFLETEAGFGFVPPPGYDD